MTQADIDRAYFILSGYVWTEDDDSQLVLDFIQRLLEENVALRVENVKLRMKHRDASPSLWG